MAGVLLLSKCVRKADLGGAFGPTWTQRIDSLCLRTASMEWNVPGTHGPHGELLFFLIQKEPATVPGSETFSPSLMLTSAPPFSPLMSSRCVRSSPCT